jgi:threonyl-tRNA synthetase
MLIIGEREAEGDLVSVRYRGGKQENGVATDDFIAQVQETVRQKHQL